MYLFKGFLSTPLNSNNLHIFFFFLLKWKITHTFKYSVLHNYVKTFEMYLMCLFMYTFFSLSMGILSKRVGLSRYVNIVSIENVFQQKKSKKKTQWKSFTCCSHRRLSKGSRLTLFFFFFVWGTIKKLIILNSKLNFVWIWSSKFKVI